MTPAQWVDNFRYRVKNDPGTLTPGSLLFSIVLSPPACRVQKCHGDVELQNLSLHLQQQDWISKGQLQMSNNVCLFVDVIPTPLRLPQLAISTHPTWVGGLLLKSVCCQLQSPVLESKSKILQESSVHL